MKKTAKTKARKSLEARRRQHKLKRIAELERVSTEKAKPFFDPWMEQRFEEMKNEH